MVPSGGVYELERPVCELDGDLAVALVAEQLLELEEVVMLVFGWVASFCLLEGRWAPHTRVGWRSPVVLGRRGGGLVVGGLGLLAGAAGAEELDRVCDHVVA